MFSHVLQTTILIAMAVIARGQGPIRRDPCPDEDFHLMIDNFRQCTEAQRDSFLTDFHWERNPLIEDFCRKIDAFMQECDLELRGPCLQREEADRDAAMKSFLMEVLPRAALAGLSFEGTDLEECSAKVIDHLKFQVQDSHKSGNPPCSQVDLFINRLEYARCRAKVSRYLKESMAAHQDGDPGQMMSDVCQAMDSLANKCGGILRTCHAAESVRAVNREILDAMRKFLDGHQGETGSRADRCLVYGMASDNLGDHDRVLGEDLEDTREFLSGLESSLAFSASEPLWPRCHWVHLLLVVGSSVIVASPAVLWR